MSHKEPSHHPTLKCANAKVAMCISVSVGLCLLNPTETEMHVATFALPHFNREAVGMVGRHTLQSVIWAKGARVLA